MSMLACLALGLLATVAIVDAASKCANNMADGDTTTRGIYWYQCRDGTLQVQGCVTDDKKQLAIGESFIARNMELTCMQTSVNNVNVINLAPTACMYNGQRVAPSSTLEDGAVWYTCERVTGSSAGDYLLWKPSGCVSQGKRLAFQERTRVDNKLLECQRVNKDVQLTVVGCVQNGADHMLGDRFNDDKNLYACETDGQGAPQLRVFGCVFHGKPYFDYQTYTDGDQIYKCQVNEQRSSATATVTGCVQQLRNGSLEKQIGCFWIQQDEAQVSGQESYLMNCKLDEQSGKSKAERVRCLYTAADGTQVDLESGCYRPLKNSDQSVACMPGTANKGLQISTFATEREDFTFINRLKLC